MNFSSTAPADRILSGAMHYFRIPPQYWPDRIRKLRAMGLNTLETYVAWNLHEPTPGEYDFSGMLDLERYIQLAAEEGLKVIVRPGPYICAEWEMGGLPWWLLKDPEMKLRCCYPPYLAAVDRWFDQLIPRIAALQESKGGPVMAVQVENEYGNYGDDHDYMAHIRDGLRRRGLDCLLFTSDGPGHTALQAGTLPEIYKTVNFGFAPRRNIRSLRKFQPDAVPMVTEFWDGWFNHWGEPHHPQMPTVLTDGGTTGILKTILDEGVHVNLYMFHGGTNFGWMNGANALLGRYFPEVTSYDYGAPLSECGDPTPKYMKMRKVIEVFTGKTAPAVPPALPKKAYGTVELKACAGLLENLEKLGKRHLSPTSVPMEALDQAYGFILYRTHIEGPARKTKITLRHLHDRALVFVDGRYLKTLEREKRQETFNLQIPAGGLKLDILVENQGRVNYGPETADRKGITELVLVGGLVHFGWEIHTLPLSDLSGLTFQADSAACPAFFRGTFEVDEPADTFLALPGWSKGQAWVNGFNLGRYWKRGPQHTLYVPAPVLKKGTNELVVFELHQSTPQQSVELCDKPDLGNFSLINWMKM